MINKTEISALIDYLKTNEENNPRIAKSFLEDVVSIFEENKQYRAIGTVEECREAMERQIVRKPSKIDVQPYFRKHCANKYSCPLCHQKIGTHQQKFCSYCGQKLDWSE